MKLAPDGLIQVNGRYVVRRCGVQHRSRPITCVGKHVIEERPSLIEGVDVKHCRECGLAVYVVSMHGGYQLRADLTGEEAQEIRARSWRLGDVLSLVGAELGERVA